MNKKRIFELKIENPSHSYEYLRTKIEDFLQESHVDYDKIIFSESRIKDDVKGRKNDE